MKNNRRRAGAGLLLAVLLGACADTSVMSGTRTAVPPAGGSRPPNILMIVADDLGYSDIGAFGGEIHTPHLDALALQGRLLTNFHMQAVCSPSRACLLTGVDHHIAGVGNMAELVGTRIQHDTPSDLPWGRTRGLGYDQVPDGYRGHLSARVPTIAEKLRRQGYRTVMAGKWHLGYDVGAPDANHRTAFRPYPHGFPSERGFDRSFALLSGGGAHFAPPMAPQLPTPFDFETYLDDGRPVSARQLPRDFYSTRAYTDRLIDYIDEARSRGQPFFAYAAYTAPHWPLHAPETDIAAQRGRYDAGYEAVRESRIARLKQLGLWPAEQAAHPGVPSAAEGGEGAKRWSELSTLERAREARVMEVYAAMVSNLDAHIGRLLQHLEDHGEFDRTLVLFMSDNGAESAEPFLVPRPGTRVNNQVENLGHPGSAAGYGARWAEVSSAPWRHFKGFTGAEGGTISPLIVKMPGQRTARPPVDARLHVTDVVPTLLDAAGVSRWAGAKEATTTQLEGRSLWAALQETGEFPHAGADGRVQVSELMGAAYVVKGRWKLSRQPGPDRREWRTADTPWRLFDLHADRAERVDLASTRPDIVRALAAEYERYVRRVGALEHATVFSGR